MVSHEADLRVLAKQAFARPRGGSPYFGLRRRRKGSRHHNYGFIAHFVPSGASANSLLLLLLFVVLLISIPWSASPRWFNLFLSSGDGGRGVSTAIARIFMFIPPLLGCVRGACGGDCEGGQDGVTVS